MSIETSSPPPVWAQVKVGFFASVKTSAGIGENLPLASILRDIRSGRWAKEIAKLRGLSADIERAALPEDAKASKASYDRLKTKLPAIMASGTTADRRHTQRSVGTHSGLLQLDADKLPSLQAAEALRDRWQSDPLIVCAFVSPGGRGVKGLIRIPADLSGHKSAWQSVAEFIRSEYDVELDEKPKNPASLCFVSHDPGLWWKDAPEFPVPERVLKAEKRAITNTGEEAAPHGGKEGTGSSVSLHPACLHTAYLHNTPLPAATPSGPDVIRATLEFERTHPLLARLVQSLCSLFLPLEEGSRNTTLTRELAPRLFSAVAHEPAARVLDYLAASGQLGGYGRREAQDKFFHTFDALAENYPATLAPSEQTVFLPLDERHRDAFRITRALALIDDLAHPPPRFFLSSGALAARLGIRDMMQTWRILRRFEQWHLVRVLDRGTRRAPGQPGKAAEFAWAFPLNAAPPSGPA